MLDTNEIIKELIEVEKDTNQILHEIYGIISKKKSSKIKGVIMGITKQVLQQADRLFDDKKFADAYQLLRDNIDLEDKPKSDSDNKDTISIPEDDGMTEKIMSNLDGNFKFNRKDAEEYDNDEKSNQDSKSVVKIPEEPSQGPEEQDLKEDAIEHERKPNLNPEKDQGNIDVKPGEQIPIPIDPECVMDQKKDTGIADIGGADIGGSFKVHLYRNEEEQEFYDRIHKNEDKVTQTEIINMIQNLPPLRNSKDVLGGRQFTIGWQYEFDVFTRSQITEALELSSIDQVKYKIGSFTCHDFNALATTVFRFKYGICLATVDAPSCNHSFNAAVIRKKDGDLGLLVIEPQNDETFLIENYAKLHDLSSLRITLR